MKLSRFLAEHLEEILNEWEAYAKTLEPAANAMSSDALRDHAHQMIMAIALDIDTPQTQLEQLEKSHGEVPPASSKSAASLHGTLREISGFSLVQLTGEFRALRASVMRLWLPGISKFTDEVNRDLVRFNEAVDEALAESAVTFAEHNNQTRERFLAILGHDLRTPISAIGMSGALLERSEDASANAAIGRRLRRSAATMSTMVNDLLEYARTQLGGKMPMSPGPADMVDIYQAALHDVRTAHPDCDFQTQVRGDTVGVFDSVRLQQVITNLLTNAAQYRARESSVLLNITGEADEVAISVKNVGTPIPPAALETVFSAMVQLPVDGEQSGRPRTSLGLGLFVARETALAHGGSIDVISDADGTVFTVRIPRRAHGA